jgi:hypothetical protein
MSKERAHREELHDQPIEFLPVGEASGGAGRSSADLPSAFAPLRRERPTEIETNVETGGLGRDKVGILLFYPFVFYIYILVPTTSMLSYLNP